MKSKLNHITLIIVSIVLLSALQSCSLFVKKKEQEVKVQEPAPSHIGYTKGNIINYSLDGCSWMIEIENNKKLEPVNLKEEFKKEGLKVWVKYQHYENYSFCMAGEMVNITEIEVRQE